VLRVVEEGGKTLLKVVFFQEKGTKVDVTWNLQLQKENSFEIVQHETFAPVLYLLKYSGTVENANFKTEWLKDYHLRLWLII
jgi:aldehyde dehydrogenase (NAD+)